MNLSSQGNHKGEKMDTYKVEKLNGGIVGYEIEGQSGRFALTGWAVMRNGKVMRDEEGLVMLFNQKNTAQDVADFYRGE